MLGGLFPRPGITPQTGKKNKILLQRFEGRFDLGEGEWGWDSWGYFDF